MKSASEVQAEILSRAASDEGFRERLLASPKATLQEELSIDIPDFYEVKVVEDGPSVAHLVLPPSAKLTEADLRAAQGGWNECSNPDVCPHH